MVKKEKGKMIATMYMMKYFSSLYGLIDYPEYWSKDDLNNIPPWLAACNDTIYIIIFVIVMFCLAQVTILITFAFFFWQFHLSFHFKKTYQKWDDKMASLVIDL